MITNAAIIKGLGLPIGDITVARIDSAVMEAEMAVVKPAIGDANYIALYDETGNWMNGGVVTDPAGNSRYVAGFANAISYIAYAHLLRHNLVATVFGTVQKQDEHSSHPDPWEEAKYYFTEGWQMLRDCCAAKGWPIINNTNYYTRTI